MSEHEDDIVTRVMRLIQLGETDRDAARADAEAGWTFVARLTHELDKRGSGDFRWKSIMQLVAEAQAALAAREARR